MKTIKLVMVIKKLEGFSESRMIEIIKKDLLDVNAIGFRYSIFEEGYRFEIDYDSHLQIPEYELKPILGCFSGIELEYDRVKLIGIPQSQIEVI